MCREFDRVSWRQRCELLAKQANKGCGLVYESYERSFTLSINQELGQLDAGVKDEAIEIAKRFGWATAEQLAKSQRLMDEDCSCRHGIDPRWCPVGCGDM